MLCGMMMHQVAAASGESPALKVGDPAPALMLEDYSRNATVMLPILRDVNGVFTHFGDPGPMQFGQSTGRFSGLMPRNKPSVREAALADSFAALERLEKLRPAN